MKNGKGKLLDYWMPPEGAGRPIGCVATTFTFEPDFFESECLGRFLALDARRGESEELDLAFLIHQEERLAETTVSVIVDRSDIREGRSLRWDVLPVGVRTGVQHAKVAILVWDRMVRGLVTSANLVEGAYRRNVELAVALDASVGGQVPLPVFEELIDAVQNIVRRAEGSEQRPGPLRRALQTLGAARDRVRGFDLRKSPPAGVKVGVVPGGPGTPVLPKVSEALRGGPPRHAIVMSPFFDTREQRSLAGEALSGLLAKRGSAEVQFVVPVDTMEARTLVRAPPALRRAIPERINVEFRPFIHGEEGEIRRLHGKALLLENDRWTTVVVGSSNFTAAGLALSPHRANLELNVALTVPRRSTDARGLRDVFASGDALDLLEIEWSPEEDAEDDPVTVLPWGFRECLLDPAIPELLMTLAEADLPPRWTVSDGVSGETLLDSNVWSALEDRSEVRCAVSRERFPLFLEVEWDSDAGVRRAGWAVNVTEPAKLPPPEALRSLSASALIRALASTRPIHEALARALIRQGPGKDTLTELDPLKRYSDTGQLLGRARQVSAALSGLQERLQRPLRTMDALEWRLSGPLGPRALAEGLARAAQAGDALPGEVEFLLAELALTLSRVDWKALSRPVPLSKIRAHARTTLNDIERLRGSRSGDLDPGLASYVDRAFAEALR